MFGLTVEEASGPPVELWPDCALPVNVFIAMSTQWRTGMAGATGLDYSALPAVMQLVGIPKAQQASVFDDLRVLEDAALEQMRKETK